MTSHSTIRRTTGRRARFSMLAALTTMTLIGANVTSTASAASPIAARAASVAPMAARVLATSAPAAAPLAAAAPPAGEFLPQGCSPTGDACDLYAMTGTASVLGAPVPIWGFSGSGAADSATAPGPVLVVTEGTNVKITLHNMIDGQQVSLALPGQSGISRVGTGPGDDTEGIPFGGSRTYSFTASRPGTFLYEAGHTANGTRQVAMGLAGALIVLPANGSPYGLDPAKTDDSVLVLSEIDPELNKAPATFDMRNFHPAYRLINGKPFPSSDPVSTDQGHTVLVRYVNVGSQTHPMSVLGATQTEVAQDGHPMKYPTTVTAESVDPGMTLDTLVTMPTGPEAKVAVYEAAMHLDNAGQNNGTATQLAFGGMMTFLDTNAPAPSTDGVGPVSTHITVSPSPSDGKKEVTVTADVTDPTWKDPNGIPVVSNVSQAEFVVDDAVTTGVGFGIPMNGPFGTTSVTGAFGTIPINPSDGNPCATTTTPVALTCLDAGKHIIYVRGLDSAGNWGVIGSVVFNLPKTGPQTTNGSLTPALTNGQSEVSVSTTGDDSAAGKNIDAAEYFIDIVGADGTGTALTLNQAATIVSEDGIIPIADVSKLTEGEHHIFVHSRDTLGLWGPPLDLTLNIDLTGPTAVVADVAPNPTNGVLGDQANPGYLAISAQFSDLDAGKKPQHRIVAAEAFFNVPAGTSPVPGSGLQLLAVNGAFGTDPLHPNVDAVYGLIPLSEFNGLTDNANYVAQVRAKDEAGNWGQFRSVKIEVDKTAPLLGALTVTPNPTNGAGTVNLSAPYTEANTLAGAEYWFGATDPGAGNATSTQISLTTVGLVKTVTTAQGISLAGLRGGQYRVNMRVIDNAGNWSAPVSRTFTVTPYLTSGLTATPNPTNGASTISLSAAVQVPANGLAGAQYWTGNVDPGLTGATQTTVTVVNGRATITGVDVSRLPTGTTTFTMRVKDTSGRWSNNATGSVAIRQNLIFASTFQTPALADWAARTGLVTNPAAAALSSTLVAETPPSTLGLRAAIPAGTAARGSYVTDRHPTLESKYFARFLFNPSTLNSGATANILTIFEGRGLIGQAFAVQYRGAGATAQIRLVLDRNPGQSAVLGSWVTVGTGTKLLAVSWASALTLTGSGSVSLQINGTTQPTLTGTNSLVRITSVNLGVSTGATAAAGSPTGAAYFDTFTSTRFIAP